MTRNYITLYHGTTLENKRLIQLEGLKFIQGSHGSRFGTWFTTKKNEALSYGDVLITRTFKRKNLSNEDTFEKFLLLYTDKDCNFIKPPNEIVQLFKEKYNVIGFLNNDRQTAIIFFK